jgi:hypothetical protein
MENNMSNQPLITPPLTSSVTKSSGVKTALLALSFVILYSPFSGASAQAPYDPALLGMGEGVVVDVLGGGFDAESFCYEYSWWTVRYDKKWYDLYHPDPFFPEPVDPELAQSYIRCFIADMTF